ncbi:HigB_toxin, RelE-like toxic component of a toxin-antitoxin system [Dyadobacter soli]|uniref:HigB_toxin, RelE-like toxic component of a toxin-antitoxin system n=1 Tax=Dyadobacter soli TaxID=659014 RepID=A0A1G7RW37_9BACT|nr:type II toxin-antitoxin system HigB family toxin [Dyadobacter soli]SDG14958.1 HigB_toxin, RelE-like toxic component of a toxin-antitoxin system [Dyadobacter soli]
MVIYNKTKLIELKRKNLGNKRLTQAVDQLIEDLEDGSITSINELIAIRRDADRVHSQGFYFFDLHIHRTLVLIQFDEKQAKIVWTGTHQEYIKTFKNNTKTIEKWLRTKDLLN